MTAVRHFQKKFVHSHFEDTTMSTWKSQTKYPLNMSLGKESQTVTQ